MVRRMIDGERRVSALKHYDCDLARRLFPRGPSDGFFEEELRSQFSEMLSCMPSNVRFSVQKVIDYARVHTPKALEKCLPQFRHLLELRWQSNQAAIIRALERAHERGLEFVVVEGVTKG